jgi:ubiquinone/menaquinone biosynthesis C-methylase UbiE
MRLKNLFQKLHLISGRNDSAVRALKEKQPTQKKKREIAIPNLRLSYGEAVSGLLANYDPAAAMSLAVGGNYEIMGEALRMRLERFGLKDGDYLIDVGCGSGRVAHALSRSKYRDTIRYLGIDIVPTMLEFAAEKCQRPSWRFELIVDLKIPEADERADMVCFFSVFTHLLQEESFIYLREAQRVLKPGGKIVVSYLDIGAPKHWKIFEANVNSAQTRQSKPMDMFLSEDFLTVWADKLKLEILEHQAPDGGQRACILQKR